MGAADGVGDPELSVEALALDGKNDGDGAWVSVDRDDVSSVSDWDSPSVSPRAPLPPPTGVPDVAAKPAGATPDAAERGADTSAMPSTPDVPVPAAAAKNEDPTPAFDLRTDYLPASVDSVAELAKDRTYKVTLKTQSPAAKPLQMFVGDAEGRALLQAHRGWKWQSQGCRRPLTYDFLKNVVEALGRKVTYVRISASERGVFYASAHFAPGADGMADMATLEGVDSRPSDALNLALRTGADIYVHRALVAEAA